MNVKGVEPFHLLPLHMLRGIVVLQQISIGQFPEQRRHENTTYQIVPYNGRQEEGERPQERGLKGNGVREGGQEEKGDLHQTKGGIVAVPMILGLFAIIGRLVNGLRPSREQCLHLVQCGLQIHLPYIQPTMPEGRRMRMKERLWLLLGGSGIGMMMTRQ